MTMEKIIQGLEKDRQQAIIAAENARQGLEKAEKSLSGIKTLLEERETDIHRFDLAIKKLRAK